MNPHRAPSKNHCLPHKEDPLKCFAEHSWEQGSATDLPVGFLPGSTHLYFLRHHLLFMGKSQQGPAALVDSMCDLDDSVFPLNGMHGKLSKEYLDKFPEDRSAEDIRLLPAGTVFSPGERTQGRAAISAGFHEHRVDWLGLV